MAEIIIRELDTTSAGAAEENLNVAFIPGFVGCNKFTNSDNVDVTTFELCGVLKGEDTWCFATASVTSSASPKIEVAITPSGFNTKIGFDPFKAIANQTKTFTFDGENWKLGTETVTITQYGIAITNTPASGDTIEVTTFIAPTIIVNDALWNSQVGFDVNSASSDKQFVITYDSTGDKWEYTSGSTTTSFALENFGITLNLHGAELVDEDSITIVSHVGTYVATDNVKKYVVCNSIDAFESYFGKLPYHEEGVGYEKSYIYAKQLIRSGLPVVYFGFNPIDAIASKGTLNAFMIDTDTSNSNVPAYKIAFSDTLLDKGELNIKFITFGGYSSFITNSSGTPTTTIADKMLNIASVRGDCIALIDSNDDVAQSLDITNNQSVYNQLQTWKIDESASDTFQADAISTFGTMFYPWSTYFVPSSGELSDGSTKGYFILPASFGFLTTLAISVRNNPNWYSVAGVTRGQVPNYINAHLNETLTNSIADKYQPRDKDRSINCITNIRNYGYTIWGNRTLKNNSTAGELVATSFLNIRNLMCDVKKTVFTAAQSLMFEQDTDVLWLNFNSKIANLLDRMVTNSGLTGYKILREPTDKKGQIKATIKLYPVYAVESFDVTVVLSDEEVTVE